MVRQLFSGVTQHGFADPKPDFDRYAKFSDKEAIATATSIWNRITLVNLREISTDAPRADRF